MDRMDADPNDVVFIDFMSLFQAGGWLPKVYLDFNPAARRNAVEVQGEMVRLSGRTDAQERKFRFALFETTRLYAYRGCAVLVLPEIEGPETFPSPGVISVEENDACHPPRLEQKSAWGFSKSMRYENSGWPCAEYAVARMNKTIANTEDEGVKRVEMARTWPRNVEEYSKLMDEDSHQPVAFTKKGDRDAVRFNFYKYSYHIEED